MAKKPESHWEQQAKKILDKLQTDKPFDDETKMSFGKYKDKPLQDVPEEYLIWLLTDTDMAEKVRLFNYIKQDLPLFLGIAHDKRSNKR